LETKIVPHAYEAWEYAFLRIDGSGAVFDFASKYVRINTYGHERFLDSLSFTGFRYFSAAVGKQKGQAIVVGMSVPCVLADGSNPTGLPKDCPEVYQISREEYEAVRR
jgi:hypothetical protein